MPTAPLLAIESTQRGGSVALWLSDGAVREESLRGDRAHDADLMPAVERLCLAADVAPRALRAVAVAVGPGGFTGVRIGVTAARTIAWTLGIGAIAVPAADAIALAIPPRARGWRLSVALAVKGESVWSTTYRSDGEIWRCESPGALLTSSAVPLDNETILAGDEFIPSSLRARAALVVPPLLSAGAVARAAAMSPSVHGAHADPAGDVPDPLHVLPLYPRIPEAVSLWDVRHGGEPDSAAPLAP